MPYKFAFYIHHHGSGHLMRAIAIAKALDDCAITFLGSDLQRYRHLIPVGVSCIDLPMDTHTDRARPQEEQPLPHLHYSPLHIPGIAQRNRLIIDYFCTHPESVLIVDVSCEILQLARLCAVPTVAIRQHGNRTDLAHTLAYESAALIIAPYARNMSSMDQEGKFAEKTFFSGGFSRYSAAAPRYQSEEANHIAITVGRGGTKIDENFIQFLRQQIPADVHMHVVGHIDASSAIANGTFHGHLADPASVFGRCSLVISNAGHNSIMELADLQKRVICIAAQRPFDEQVIKAQHLERLGVAINVDEEDCYTADWKELLERGKSLDPQGWEAVTNQYATRDIAEQLKKLYRHLYRASSADAFAPIPARYA